MIHGLAIDDPQIMRECLRDVVAMATLPAIWTGAETVRIVESLASSLFTTVDPAFVYVCFGDGERRLSVVQTGRYESSAAIGAEAHDRIFEWARTSDPEVLLPIDDPFGRGLVHLTARAVGHRAELGVIAAAFKHPDEATPVRHLLLNMAATQATVAIQNANVLDTLRESEARKAVIAIENTRLVEELRHADRAKDEFLATLAHELRNPLAPLRNGLELLRIDGNPASEAVRTMMERQVEHLVHLVDDLMDVSRITRGRIALRKSLVELNSVIGAAVETVSPTIERMRHTLRVDLPTDIVIVDGDATRLAQVFANLLNNASKYTPSGGEIELTAAVVDNEVIVTVRDNGVGIPPDQLSRIFEMFTQAERSLDRAQGGLGIGLTLAQRFMSMHGGTLRAHSDGEGTGATFVATLPVASIGERRNGEAASPDRSSVRSGLRILVVDDNRDSAESLSLILSRIGNDVRTVYDGESAIEATAEFVPDVVLLDLGLPQISGFEVCRRIRSQHLSVEPVIIAQTGWGQAEDRVRTAEAGFDLHLVKPVEPRQLLDALAQLSTR